MVLPFPYGLGAALALFIAFPLILRRRMMNKMRGGYGGALVQVLVVVLVVYSVKTLKVHPR